MLRVSVCLSVMLKQLKAVTQKESFNVTGELLRHCTLRVSAQMRLEVCMLNVTRIAVCVQLILLPQTGHTCVLA